ncbi:hypothetical protein GCM10010964_15310 [Caldovatus sediminis]|uniref:histidine kinase n=1 Tax=Caldovatus sediminis TaxID=2041189 RepID=A0A8J2ZA24_9PROT|nr:PAS domain S-box protein [Caldovatus sediminis]GGG28338.1 hypothetical protein GCM10010964_15310 [Caldovatus sediminis]
MDIGPIGTDGVVTPARAKGGPRNLPATAGAAPRPRGNPRRLPGLWAHLAGLVLAVLIPSLALGAVTAWWLAENYRVAFEERLSGTARALAAAADAEIGAVITAAATLAASPLLDTEQGLSAFDVQARPVGAAFGTWVVVVRTADMRQIVNTRLPPGAPLPDAFSPAAVAETMGGHDAVVRDLATVPFRTEPVVAVLAPVLRGAEAPAKVVAIPLDPARLERLLKRQELDGGAFAALVDGRGVIVARSLDHARFVGRPAPDWYPRAVEGRARGLLRGPTHDGAEIILAFERLRAAPQWTVVVAGPVGSYYAAWLDPLLGLAAGGAAAIALGIALAGGLSHRILRPVAALVRRADAAATDAGPPPPGAAPAFSPRFGVAEFEALRDATERAETALREANRRTAEVLGSLGEVLYALDADRRFGFASARALATWGRRPEEVLGRRFEDAFPETVGSLAWEVHRQAMASREEVHLCLPSAVLGRWIEMDVYPRGDGGITVAFRDIEDRRRAHVERVRAEKALRTSEERLRLALDAAALGVWEVDLETRIVRRSPRTVEIFGFSRGAEVGIYPSWRDRMHPEDRAAVAAAFEAVCAGRTKIYRAQFRSLRPDGRWVWIESHGRVIERDPASGAPRRLVGISQDITERKTAEAALAASEARLRLAVDAGRMAVWEADLVSGSVAGSAELNRLLGFPEDATPTLADMRARYYPGELERLRAIGQFALARGERFIEAEFRYLWPDGSVRWLLLRAEIHIEAGSGRPFKAVGVVMDVTDRKTAEERQALLMRELDHRAKNALAVVQAALRLTPRDDPEAYARAVEGRVAALARAHTVLARGRWEGAALRSLVEGELAAFLPAAEMSGRPEAEAAASRIGIEGPALTLAPAAAQALSMALHELATNATKHGALSVPAGRVAVSWRVDGAAGLLRLRWEERGGPPVAAPPARRGFGSRVIEATVRDQLGGRVARHWNVSGLACEIEVPLARALAAKPAAPGRSPQAPPARAAAGVAGGPAAQA